MRLRPTQVTRAFATLDRVRPEGLRYASTRVAERRGVMLPSRYEVWGVGYCLLGD